VTGDASHEPCFRPNCSPTKRDPTPSLTCSRISYVPNHAGFSVSPQFEKTRVILTGCTRILCGVRHLRLGSSMPRNTAIQLPHVCFPGPPTVAWRVEVVNDDKHRGFECVRWGTRCSYPTRLDGLLTLLDSIFWGTTKWARDLDGGQVENGTRARRSRVPKNYITERFHRPGVLLGRRRLPDVADLEVNAREGRKCVHTFTAIVRSARLGLPPSILRGCNRAVLHSCSSPGVRERRFWHNSDRGHYHHHPQEVGPGSRRLRGFWHSVHIYTQPV